MKNLIIIFIIVIFVTIYINLLIASIFNSYTDNNIRKRIDFSGDDTSVCKYKFLRHRHDSIF